MKLQDQWSQDTRSELERQIAECMKVNLQTDYSLYCIFCMFGCPVSKSSVCLSFLILLSTLALKIPWMVELGAGYYPWGHKESGTTERLHFISLQ